MDAYGFSVVGRTFPNPVADGVNSSLLQAFGLCRLGAIACLLRHSVGPRMRGRQHSVHPGIERIFGDDAAGVR